MSSTRFCQDLFQFSLRMASLVASAPKSGQPHRNKLDIFLLGTLDPNSPLRILRGQEDVLRIIWSYACSEWWSLHVERYSMPYLPEPSHYYEGERPEHDPSQIADLRKYNLFERKMFFDCPFVIVDDHLSFPAPVAGEPLNVNMMPIDIMDLERTVPEFLHQYLPMIRTCVVKTRVYIDAKRQKAPRQRPSPYENPRESCNTKDMRNRIAYLTVDERPVSAGQSQRRGGVHVESPGAMRHQEVGDKSQYTPDLSFYHPWGLGRSTGEFLEGGIFLASNTADSTAVWNCRIHDTFGDIIGPNGSLERMRDFLGPPTKKLAAGEMIWLSDRTPHESLPLPEATRRQFFRLVVGEIGFWFPHHNTPNPTGFALPSWVKVIEGNKFITPRGLPVTWEAGDAEEIIVAREEAIFRRSLYKHCVGFMADELLRRGVYSVATLCAKSSEMDTYIDSLDSSLYSGNTKRFIKIGLHRIRIELAGQY